ncbi:MAG: hypothetical protein EOO09_13230, partial [Chitinophagaceae bacterium]
MKLQAILESYDTVVLDQISADKVDEVVNLRLPQPVIVQEIIGALTSQSYISSKIQYGRPPMYAILNLILQAPDHGVSVEGFREAVLAYVNDLSSRAGQNKHGEERSIELYTKILKRAWENDGIVDKSEAHILELVKDELCIYDQEHFALMHDPSIISLWDIDQEYYLARNILLSSGIILAFENKYIIAEEVAVQIRKTFGIELMDNSLRRMLNRLGKEELAVPLTFYKVSPTGTKEILVDRLVNTLVPPTDLLGLLHLETLREFCRQEGIPVGGQKNAVIANIIQFYEENRDLKVDQPQEPVSFIPTEPELREMNADTYSRVLFTLTGQQLYDILYQSHLTTSGSKEDKVKRIMESPWSERSVFNHLRKEDLVQLCRRFSLPLSGSKQELVDRVLDYVPPVIPVDPVPEIPPPVEPATPEPVIQNEAPLVPAAPPSLFEEINNRFPELEPDEQTILAIVKGAKSVTEQDIERIVTKHG